MCGPSTRAAAGPITCSATLPSGGVPGRSRTRASSRLLAGSREFARRATSGGAPSTSAPGQYCSRLAIFCTAAGSARGEPSRSTALARLTRTDSSTTSAPREASATASSRTAGGTAGSLAARRPWSRAHGRGAVAARSRSSLTHDAVAGVTRAVARGTRRRRRWTLAGDAADRPRPLSVVQAASTRSAPANTTRSSASSMASAWSNSTSAASTCSGDRGAIGSVFPGAPWLPRV